MAIERHPINRAFYRKLLTFYPRPFRERFGESMEQTFDDLCKEQEGKVLSLTLHLSVDTGFEIVKEHVLHLSQRGVMTRILKNPKIAAVVGILLFLPGTIMFSLMLMGIEPSIGPLQPFLQPTDPDAPHVLGSLVFLSLILVLPAAAVLINIAATEGNALKGVSSNLGLASILGFLLVLPLMVLELTYGQKSYSSFPTGLFVILWILPVLFVLILAPVIQSIRSGNNIAANPVTLVLRIAFLVLITVFWLGFVNDQMPCFLGVPNCD